MKKHNITRYLHNLRGCKLGSCSVIVLLMVLFLGCVFMPQTSLAGTDLLQGNVKLSGKAFNYPIGIEGSPYLYENWKIANINLVSGSVAKGVKVKIDIINNDLLFYNEELKRIFIVDKGTFTGFTLNPEMPDSMIFLKYSGPDVGFKLRGGDLVQVLTQGPVTLLLVNKADVIDANDVSSKDKIYAKKSYFISGKGKISQIKPVVRAIFNYFPGKKKDLKKLIKDQKIGKSNEAALKKMIGLINLDPLLIDSFRM